jgi:hypothetical protein
MLSKSSPLITVVINGFFMYTRVKSRIDKRCLLLGGLHED